MEKLHFFYFFLCHDMSHSCALIGQQWIKKEKHVSKKLSGVLKTASLYLVTPSETSPKTVDETPDLVGQIIPVFFVCIVVEAISCQFSGRFRKGETSSLISFFVFTLTFFCFFYFFFYFWLIFTSFLRDKIDRPHEISRKPFGLFYPL